MILGVVVRHEHKLRLANHASRGFSGQCWCGYKGPWRGTTQEAKDDWSDHMRIEVGSLGLSWIYEIQFHEIHVLSAWGPIVHSVASDMNALDGDTLLRRKTPCSVSMAKGVLGYGLDL